MVRLDLSQARSLRVAGKPVERVRHLGQDVYVGEHFRDFEDGVMPFLTSKNSAGVVPVNTELSPVRSGVRSIRYGQDTASHGARVDNTLDWRRGDQAEAWVMLMPNTEANPNQARLGGICVNDADTGVYWCVCLDTRNGSGSTSAIQVRNNVSVSGVWSNPTSERIEVGKWYRLQVWVDATRVAVWVFNEAGVQIGGLGATVDVAPSRIQFGLYSYGWTVFDDYRVSPGVRAV